MANGNSLENTAIVENLTDEERLDQLEQEGNTDTEVLLFDKQIPASATILIDNKPYDYKDIQTQVNAGSYGENINSVDDYVNAFGDRASVKVGRDATGKEITEEKATMVDKSRVEDPVSEWAVKYDKNLNVNDFKIEFDKFENNVILNEEQQSEVDSFTNTDNPNYNPDLFKPYEQEFTTGGGGSSLTGYTPSQTFTKTIQPNEEVFNEAREYLESGPRKKSKKTSEVEPITRDQIEKVARIIMANKKENDYLDTNAKNYLDDIDPDLRKALFDYKINEYIEGSYTTYDSLEKQEKEILSINESIENSADYKNYNNFSLEFKKVETEVLDLKKQIEEVQKRPEILQNNIESYNALVDNFNSKLINYQEIYKGLENHAESLNVKYFQRDKKIKDYEKNFKTAESNEDLGKLLDYLKRDYSQINKIFGGLGSGQPGTFATGMIKGGIDIATLIDFQLFGTEGNPFIDVQNASQVVRKYEDKQRGRFYKPVTFEKAFDSLSNFGEFMVDQAVQQSSFLAYMSINPYLTFGVSGGGYVADRQKEASTFGGRSYTDGELRLKSIGFGATEYYFGTRATVGILKRARNRLNDIGKRELTQGYRNRFDYLYKNSPVLAWDIGLESSTEGITTVFQNGIDGKPLTQGVKESLFVGGMFGYAFSGVPTMYGAMLNNFSDYKSYESYRSNLDLIGKIYKSNANPFGITADQKTKNLELIKQLETENSEILNKIENNVNEELTSEGFNLYQSATDRQENLRTQAQEIIDNKSLSKEVKQNRLKPLKTEFDQLQNARDGFRESFTKTFPLLDKKERSRLNDLAVKNLQAKGTSIPSEQAILQEAENIYNSESIDKNAKNDLKIINNLGEAGINIGYNLSDSNTQIIKDYKEILDSHVANPNVDLTQEQADAKFNRFKEGIENGTINGINEAVLDNESGKNIYNVLVSKQNSVANGKQHTGIHEIGHTIFTEAFTSNPEAFTDLSNIILEYTKKANPEAYTRITTRTANQDADEVLTNFLEEVAAGNINFEKAKNAGFLGPIGRILGLGVSSVANTDYSFNFKGETDVANFLTNLAKKLKAGDLSVKDIRTIKQEGIAGRKVDDDVIVETKESLTPSQQQLKQRFTNEQLLRKRKNAEGKELSDINNILIEAGARIGLRAMGFDTRKGLGNISYNDALQTARTRIAERGLLDKFNPKINDNWSTYVGANLRFDIKDVIQQNQVSVDAASIDTEAAKQIADPTTVEVDQAVDTDTKRKINVLKNFDGVNESNITNIVKVKKGDTYKEVSNYTGEVGSNIFNIPANKITVGKENLTYAKKIVDGVPETSEAGNIQDWIRKGKNAENFIKILPRQSVTSDTADINELGENIDVDRDVLGLAIGLKGLVQNYFYNKTNKRSKGKKSQPFIWELKPEFINPTIDVINKLKVDAGITEAGQLNNYNRDIGQLLKGVAKVYSQQAAFSAAQRNLEATIDTAKDPAKVKKQIAGITAAQSKTAFSETNVEQAFNIFMEDQSFKRNPTEFAAENKNWTKIIEEFVGKDNAINMRTEAGVQRFLKIAEENGFVEKIPKSVWRSLQGTTDAITIKEAGIIKGRIDGFQVDVRDFAGNFPFRNVKEADAWIASVEKKGKKFAEEGLYEDMTTKVTNSQYNNLEKLLNNKDFVKSQDNSLKGLKQLFLTFESLMKDGNKENIAFVGAMLSSTSSYQGHFMRTAAPVRFYAKNTFGQIVQEHTLPASITAKYLFTSAVAGKINQNFNNVGKNYFQGALPKIYDDALVGFKPNGKPYNYKENTPEGWKITDNIWARYFNENVFSIDPSNIILTNGKSIVQEFGIDAKGFATNNSIEVSKKKAFNKNPKSKFSKSNTNEGLLNDLNNYDKALRNARDLNAPKKGISIFDFDDTLATSKSKVIVTVPEQVQKITGTGNAVKVINTVYKGVVDLIAKNKKIKSINFSSDAAESSRIKLYNTLADKLKKDLGWSLNLFETTSFGKKESEDFTLTKPKEQKDIKTLGSNLNFTEDTVGNFKSSFEINNRTYNVSLDKKGEGDYELNFSLIGEGKGKTFKLTPQQFAKQHSDLELQGAEFDFSEFNKVVDGKPGPLAAKIKKQIDKFGNKDVFILTARPQASATSIKAFLDGIGINIPLENITGLEDGTPQAKANWVVGKAAEGYNDFYFTDDVYKNVKAVQDALEVLDVKSKTRLAYSDRVKKLDKDFNDILEAKTGIASEKEYGSAKAQVVGANKGKFNFFIPPSAEDFVGLLYNTLGKGKLGDAQMAWYKKNLLDPYASAMAAISKERIGLMDDYKALKNQLGIVPKNLRKKIPGETFTNEQALRVYIWNKQGITVPGLSKTDLKELTDYIESKPEFKVFGDQLIAINKGDGYAAPTSGWLAGTITTDLTRGLGTTKRVKHLGQWQQNVDIIFSEKNLNKLEAAFGKPYRVALEGILQRMKTGRNRSFTGDSKTGKLVDWLTNSIGTIMFFNTRSALLQTISAVNFVNFSDNNIFKAGKAYANQKQYWSDFMTLMNSEFLIDRRRGLRINVNEADIANMASQSGARGVVAKMLEIGFLPTQIADSFAIASGGATFYRNRINSYKKQGLSEKEAQKQAFNDFREIAEESQQSSRPDRISQEQAGPLGRIILAFANTPMQYARLIKKAASDLKNRRGDVKTNISKIIYYGFVQNLIFNGLQQALFAIAFGDIDDEEDQNEKYINTANNMADSLLRGSGLTGAYFSVGKNIVMRVIKESQKDNPKYEKASFDLARLSPPISSKLSRINQAGRAFQWEKDEMIEKGFSIDNPALMASANVISAATNIPIDRLVRKANNVNTALSQDLELWERFALIGGWQDWELGIEEKEKSKGKNKFGSLKNTKLKPLKTKLKPLKK